MASKNAGKIRELLEIFARTPYALETYAAYADVIEGETSYEENAALKARALRRQLRDAGIDAAVLGDDSGLEVAALGGRPGVLSARFGGVNATWAERRRALSTALEATDSRDRSARFVCVLHLIAPDGREFTGRGEFPGSIATRERGDGGFSYDPIFEIPNRGLTFAELPEEEKNRISQRARAAAALLRSIGDAERAHSDEPERVGPSGKQRATGM